jgi:hypothetical protein
MPLSLSLSLLSTLDSLLFLSLSLPLYLYIKSIYFAFTQAKGEAAEADGRAGFAYKTVSCIGDRSMWVIPSSECPSCNNEEGDAIDVLASIKILLK